MNDKLKPCPFCGGECKIKAAKKEYIGFTIWCECENCHARASGYCPDMKKEDTAIVNIDSCRNKAIEAWNRRANDEKIDAVKDVINNMPTAYDPDKVVEQLENLKSLVPVNRVLDDIVNDKPKELGMLIAYGKAIEIVKAGGVDGN